MRFWEIEAASLGLHDKYSYVEFPRHINIYGVDEVQDEIKDSNGAKTGRVVVHMYHAAMGTTAYYIKGTTAAEFTAELERRIAEDRFGTPPTPVVPDRLGFVHASTNKQMVSASLTTSIASYAEIEFVGRAGATVAAAFATTEPFEIRIPVEDIPINASPVLPPLKTFTVAGVGNINMSRSQDGATLYFLGDDDAQAFAMEIFGHTSV